MTKKIKINTEVNLGYDKVKMLRELEKIAGRRALERVMSRRIVTLTRGRARKENGACHLADVLPELTTQERDEIESLLSDGMNLALMALAVKKGEGEGTT